MSKSSFLYKELIPLQASVAELAYWAIFLTAASAKSLYFYHSTGIQALQNTRALTFYMLLSTISSMLLVSAVLFVLRCRLRIISILITSIFLSIILFADTLYFRYYYSAITIPVLSQYRLAASLGDSIRGLIRPVDIIYFIDIPLLTGSMFLLNRLGLKKIKPVKRYIAAMLIMVLGISGLHISYSKADTEAFQYDRNYVIKHMGILYFHYDDIKNHIKQLFTNNTSLDPDEKALVFNYYDSREQNGKNLKGSAKGKNLLIVQMEALQQFVINRRIGGKEITPNLNNLVKQSLYFSNFYYQTGKGNTSDAEFLCNTSLYPSKDGATSFSYSSNFYHTLPKALRELGYRNYSFHAYNPSFWNRSVMHKNLGFDKFYNRNDFILDEIKGWSISDSSFFRQSIDILKKEQPFYGFLITLTAHHPYIYTDDHDFDTGEYSGTLLGNYLKTTNYVDSCIGELIQLLKANDLYENTLLVIYGDHSAISRNEAGDLIDFLQYGKDEVEWLKLQRVPLLIHNPEIKNEEITVTGGQIDIAPTIANLMDFEMYYSLGKDLLNTNKGYAVMRNSSIITDDFIYSSSQRQTYDLNKGLAIDNKNYWSEINLLLKELQLSDLILSKDAFKKIEHAD